MLTTNRLNSRNIFAIAGSALLVPIAVGLLYWGSDSLSSSPQVVQPAEKPHNCRFYAMVSPSIPADTLMRHLVGCAHPCPYLSCGLPLNNSMRNLSLYNYNGWSVGYYEGTEGVPVVRRGEPSAFVDRDFDRAAEEAADRGSHVVVSHVRYCASGLCDIENPHPFTDFKNGKHWLMGHNGTIDKPLLLGLVRPEYLAANPLTIGADESEWIDTELYFRFVLQSIEDFDWQVEPALEYVIQSIHHAVNDSQGYVALNFFLSDGTKVWAYREGHSLYYAHNTSGQGYSAVASTYPTLFQGSWRRLEDGQLAILDPNNPPMIVDIP